MKNFFEILLGFAVIGYIIYVLVQIYYAATGMHNTAWGDITVHLIVVGVFIALLAIGNRVERSEQLNKQVENINTASEDSSDVPEVNTYNPHTDILKFDSIYLQEVKTWWNDSDGDYHDRGTDYAALRFYEDGKVIGIRKAQIPSLEHPDSFTYKGTWKVSKNNLSIELEKVTDVEDNIEVYISPEETRDMKYAGHIADDDSLIKAGQYTFTINGGTLEFPSQLSLTYQSASDLIITAQEETCEELAAYFKNSPLMLSAFQRTGNWYTNGETGPEWFTVHLRTLYLNKEQVEAELDRALSKLDLIVENTYWS